MSDDYERMQTVLDGTIIEHGDDDDDRYGDE